MSDLMPRSEFRHDPIQRRWVIVASERGKRPVEFSHLERNGMSQALCPLCGGKEDLTPRAISVLPGSGPWKVRIVPNKFPALRVEGELDRAAVGQYDRMAGVGAHEVIIETPEHDVQLADLPVEHLALVLQAYRDRVADLRQDLRFKYILVFKNSGSRAGASLSHSHSQVMATPVTPRTVAMELGSAHEHFQLKERCIFCDVLSQEIGVGSRIVLLDEFFATHCPYASRFPFEMHLHPRKHSHDFSFQNWDLLLKLAHHLKEVLRRMNKALANPPYNFMLHTAPCTEKRPQRKSYWETLEMDWHWHLEILPRISNVAGFEWGTGFYINPTAPEEAASHLRTVDQ